jgi:hypothetical protein
VADGLEIRGYSVLEEALAALASAGGNALVSAMMTDEWPWIKNRFTRLLKRKDSRADGQSATQLEESRALLAGRSGVDLDRTRAEQALAWRTRLGDLLEADPGVADDLRMLVAEVQALVPGSAVPVQQHVTGFGSVQQAVQGLGVQNNTFGGQGDPSAGH